MFLLSLPWQLDSLHTLVFSICCPRILPAKGLIARGGQQMHLRVLIMWLTLTVLTAEGCGGPDVRTDFDSSADFSAYRTFAFMGLKDRDQSGVLDHLLSWTRLEEMVRQQMTAKGLRQVGLDEHPDLLVRVWGGVKEKELVQSTGSMVGPYAGPSGARRYEEGGVTTYKFKEGTLSIDLMAPPKNELVWRGSIVGLLSNVQEENMQMANQGIIKAFEDYP